MHCKLCHEDLCYTCVGKLVGIKDEDIQEIEYSSLDENEMKQVQNLLTTCYINIAVVNLRAQNYSSVIETCNEVLRYDPNHVKGLFLRSKALVTPKSSGATEDDMAMKDLKIALNIEPENEVIQ